MTKKTKLIWRLQEKPTVESLQILIKTDILTKDEAREILFNLQTEEDRDKKSLESEIKFLRVLVENLSKNNNSRIVEIIREVEIPVYREYPWYQPYRYWCGTATYTDTCTGADNLTSIDYASSNFSDISTF